MDSNAIRAAIQKFTFEAAPSSGDSSAPATVGDIKKLIAKIAELSEVIADSAD